MVLEETVNTQVSATVEPFTITAADFFKPVLEAITEAIGTAIGALRAAFADTVGQILVAVYTPFYIVIDFIVSVFQLIFGLLQLIFGWLPPQIFMFVVLAAFFVFLAMMLRIVINVIKGAMLR